MIFYSEENLPHPQAKNLFITPLQAKVCLYLQIKLKVIFHQVEVKGVTALTVFADRLIF